MKLVIYCAGCETEVLAELVGGDVIYPHRPDLSHIAFYKCGYCGDYVGTHKQRYPTDTVKPLGIIPTAVMRLLRSAIHKRLDPLWQNKHLTRKGVYAEMAQRMGYSGRNFHVGELLSTQECETALNRAEQLKLFVMSGNNKI